jgi:hypothetical protein
MFGLNMYGCAVSYLNNYAEAVRFYDSCPTRRGMSERKIRGKEGSRAVSVYMHNDEVRFRYHYTDVVVWYPDNSYHVDLNYTSPSTCEFANRFTPRRHYAGGSGKFLVVGATAHPATCRLRVSATGEVSEGRTQFVREVVDRKRARIACETTGFNAYRKWHKLMFPMVQDSLPPMWKRDWFPEVSVLNVLLPDPNRWHELMVSAHSIEQVRAIIYAKMGVFDTVTAKTLPYSHNTVSKWRVY